MRFLITVASVLIATAAWCENKLGSYSCNVTNTVVLSGRAGQAWAGAIDMPPNRKKFTISIEPIQRDVWALKACRIGVDHYLDNLEIGKPYEDFDGRYDFMRREFIGAQCFAKDKLTLKYDDSKSGQNYFSYNLRSEFLGYGVFDGFYLFAGGSFRRVQMLDDGSDVLSEGQCEPIP